MVYTVVLPIVELGLCTNGKFMQDLCVGLKYLLYIFHGRHGWQKGVKSFSGLIMNKVKTLTLSCRKSSCQFNLTSQKSFLPVVIDFNVPKLCKTFQEFSSPIMLGGLFHLNNYQMVPILGEGGIPYISACTLGYVVYTFLLLNLTTKEIPCWYMTK